jgi:hypothetical protein
LEAALQWVEKCPGADRSWNEILKEVRERMSLAGAQIRSESVLRAEVPRAMDLVQVVLEGGCRITGTRDLKHAFRTRHLCFTHAVYLQAIQFAMQCRVGSRGSAIVLDSGGEKIHELLDNTWRILPEDPSFRSKLLETEVKPDGSATHQWADCASLPETDAWFESTWADFRDGRIYET